MKSSPDKPGNVCVNTTSLKQDLWGHFTHNVTVLCGDQFIPMFSHTGSTLILVESVLWGRRKCPEYIDKKPGKKSL